MCAGLNPLGPRVSFSPLAMQSRARTLPVSGSINGIQWFNSHFFNPVNTSHFTSMELTVLGTASMMSSPWRNVSGTVLRTKHQCVSSCSCVS